jgi:hypothetical protein
MEQKLKLYSMGWSVKLGGKTIKKWVDLFGSLNSEIEFGIFPT